LYTPPSTPEQAVVDRSSMGQGNIAFTVGAQSIGKNQERGPFAIDEGGYLFIYFSFPMRRMVRKDFRRIRGLLWVCTVFG
jgi:hypothetical protein